MKMYKLILPVILLILLFLIASFPTIYSPTLIQHVALNDVEFVYGECDIICENTEACYYAYKLNKFFPFIEDQYIVIERSRGRVEYEVEFKSGSDWIKEVTENND